MAVGEERICSVDDIPGLSQHFFVTGDGVRLHYTVCGHGPCILLLHGFGSDSSCYAYAMDALCDHFRVYALDQRGHGLSDKPDYGMKIARLAADVRALLSHEHIARVGMVGHSMGCAVIWSYIELFGEEGLSSLSFIDEPPMILGDFEWPDTERRNAGAFVTDIHAYARWPERPFHEDPFAWPLPNPLPGTWYSKKLLRPQWTGNRAALSRLLLNHAAQDWRDLIPRVKTPALIFTGHCSGWMESQRWMASVMQNASLSVFSQEESGGHDLFFQNPVRFDRELREFLLIHASV